MNGLAMCVADQQFGQDDLVTHHAPLIKRIAYHLSTRLPPSVQADDLIQAGMIGLLEASRNYDPSQGASFETYAGIRIRGAMLDEVRRADWAPRSVRRKARQVAEAVRIVENQHGRDARSSEVAELLGISLDEYHRILHDTSNARIFSSDDPDMVGETTADEIAPDQRHEPLASQQDEDFRRTLAQSISDLPERERIVMSLYYDGEMKLHDIGSELGMSDSRVCQIHGQALIRLRARMMVWTHDGE